MPKTKNPLPLTSTQRTSLAAAGFPSMIDRALGLRCILRLCASGGLAPMMLCCVVGSMPSLSHAHVTRRQHRMRSLTLMMDDGAGFPPPITHGASRSALANTRMLLASANPLPRLKSPRTATCLRLAAASAPRKCKTTATRLRQSSRASSPNLKASLQNQKKWK